MVEKYFQLNISSVVFHSPIFIFKRQKTLHLRPSYILVRQSGFRFVHLSFSAFLLVVTKLERLVPGSEAADDL